MIQQIRVALRERSLHFLRSAVRRGCRGAVGSDRVRRGSTVLSLHAHRPDPLPTCPLGENIYSVLETTQPEVIADRFNSSGLNVGEAARAGGFLGSWSQTLFRIGDIDITDPAGSGAPLLFPELLSLATGRHRERPDADRSQCARARVDARAPASHDALDDDSPCVRIRRRSRGPDDPLARAADRAPSGLGARLRPRQRSAEAGSPGHRGGRHLDAGFEIRTRLTPGRRFRPRFRFRAPRLHAVAGDRIANAWLGAARPGALRISAAVPSRAPPRGRRRRTCNRPGNGAIRPA